MTSWWMLEPIQIITFKDGELQDLHLKEDSVDKKVACSFRCNFRIGGGRS